MAEMPPSLFAFDVDGTLLDRDLKIRDSTRRSVRELRRGGHHVALASARPPRSVAELSLDLLGDVADIVALNGAFVGHGRELLLERTLAAADARALVRRARDLDLELNLLTGWDWLVERHGPNVAAEAAIVGFEPTVVADLEAHLEVGVHKILAIGPHPTVVSWRGWIDDQGLAVEASLSKPTYAEVVARGTSKAGAVRFLAQRLGLPDDRIVAFGDGENDLPMIAAAGTGVAMGNAVAAVKEVAALVTESHDEDGIANALQRLGYL